MSEIDLLNLYPKSNRPIEERGQLISEEHRRIARKFNQQYFDGERLYGYGGYNYHPRFWTDTVARIKDYYCLSDDAQVLDVGCGKGFMMYDFKNLMPDSNILGIDVSEYALEHALEDMKKYITIGNAREIPFSNQSFDLVISINTIHNLPLEECKQALREIQRVTRKHAFIVVDAWRTEEERQRLMKWNLTALTYMHVDDWVALFREVGYTGDYYWFIP